MKAILKHTYLLLPEQVNYSGYNKKFNVQENYIIFNKIFILYNWVGKISKRVEFITPPGIFDLNQRALLAWDLAKLMNISMPEIKLVPNDKILNFDQLAKNLKTSEFYDYNFILLSKYSGVQLEEYDFKRINMARLREIFVFDCWLGNLDKKDDDYLIDNKNKLWTIDYQLWGPIDNSGKSLGFCAKTYEINKDTLNRCIGRKTKKLILNKSKLSDFNEIIKRIRKLTNEQISERVNKYQFYKRGSDSEKINHILVVFLNERKKILEKQIIEYFNEKQSEKNQI